MFFKRKGLLMAMGMLLLESSGVFVAAQLVTWTHPSDGSTLPVASPAPPSAQRR